MSLVAATDPDEPKAAAPACLRVVQEALVDLDCSTGAPSGIPSSALIRTDDGEVVAVSFRRGWAVHQGKRPGALIAVCHDTRGVAQRRLHRATRRA